MKLVISNFKTGAVFQKADFLFITLNTKGSRFKYILNFSGLIPVTNNFSPVFLNNKLNWAVRLAVDYLPGMFTSLNFSSNNSVIFSVSKKNLFFVAQFFKYSWFFRAEELLDMFAVDFPSRINRFELTYVLLSVRKNERIYLRCNVAELNSVPSLSSLFNTANWLEREIWDMHGVSFSGNSDLRRILTDYGFFGHPLRKDFPLTGFFELRYDDSVRCVVSESVNLLQELRLFFFGTSWTPL